MINTSSYFTIEIERSISPDDNMSDTFTLNYKIIPFPVGSIFDRLEIQEIYLPSISKTIQFVMYE